MTKNEWGVEVDIGEDDFAKWDWGEDYGEAHEAFVKEISIKAAQVVIAELAANVMIDLRAGEEDASLHAFCFDGYLDFGMSLSALVADCIESFESGEVPGKIGGLDERQAAERLIAQLERAAASIRAALTSPC